MEAVKIWVFTKAGFYSVVAYDPKQDKETKSPFKRIAKSKYTHVLVRARVKDDLDGLKVVVPNVKIVDDKVADYRFRAVISRRQWKKFLNLSVDDIDYDSHFKEVMRDADPKQGAARHKAVMSVWSAMHQLQPYAPYKWEKGSGTGYGSQAYDNWWYDKYDKDKAKAQDKSDPVAPAEDTGEGEITELDVFDVKAYILEDNKDYGPDYLTDAELAKATPEAFELWVKVVELRKKLGVSNFNVDEELLDSLIEQIDPKLLQAEAREDTEVVPVEETVT